MLEPKLLRMGGELAPFGEVINLLYIQSTRILYKAQIKTIFGKVVLVGKLVSANSVRQNVWLMRIFHGIHNEYESSVHNNTLNTIGLRA